MYGSGHLSPNAQGQANDVGEGFKKNAEARADQLRQNLQKGDDMKASFSASDLSNEFTSFRV